MSVELDHVFICVSPDAPEAEALREIGLTEGTPNTHPGQGTACRRFFFRNAYVELLWVHDPAEAQSELVQPVHLWQRWSGRASGACPFAFCFRPGAGKPSDPPFNTWNYRPSYLPPHLSIGIGTNAEVITEPELFWLGFATRPDANSAAGRAQREHRVGLREITRVEWITPHAGPLSPELNAATETGLVQPRTGKEYVLALGFDRESQGKEVDLRPGLPLVLRW